MYEATDFNESNVVQRETSSVLRVYIEELQINYLIIRWSKQIVELFCLPYYYLYKGTHKGLFGSKKLGT